MLRVLFFLLVLCFACIACVVGFLLGKNVSFAQQWPLFEALRNTASIIFAVVGAWLAIIYPERLKMSFGRGKVDPTNGNGPSMGLLLTPAVHSTIMLVIILLVGVTAPLLKQIPQVIAHVELFRGLSFSILIALTLWQAAIVVMTLFPAEMVLTTSQHEKAAAEIKSRFGRLRR
jgi:hypothetical protein